MKTPQIARTPTISQYREINAIINGKGLLGEKSFTFFTLWGQCYTSSTGLQMTSIFRQENRYSYYRNDPVKYDLNIMSMMPKLVNRTYLCPSLLIKGDVMLTALHLGELLILKN